MVYNTDFSLPLPITQSAHHLATQFAQRQSTPHKATQVLHNTLAVCVVNDYLHMMGIETDLTASDSWNPVLQTMADVADLHIPGVGRLECRPMVAQRSRPTMCPVPPEVWGDRIGYVVVEIDEATRQAEILGFVPTVEDEFLPLHHLQAPEDLMDHLASLRVPAVVRQAGAAFNSVSQWLQGSIDAGWQTLESLLNPPQAEYAFRGAIAPLQDQVPGVRQAKLVELDVPLVLVVAATSNAQGEVDILLQVHPMNGVTLPAGVGLQVLDELGAVFQSVQSRTADDYIQLQIGGAPGEVFQVQVLLGDRQVTESFVI
ncbi:DUF1822 family protein [Leptolyngbya sp. AN02str]|uniref:DUF1822 family protein n=1 Tax=Leptolyngbya sp. AN02str TaxID=3423363 RepID=UPI003D31A5A7